MVVPSVGPTAAATTAAATLAAGTTAASRLLLLQCYSRYISFSYPVCVCGSTSRSSSLFDAGGHFCYSVTVGIYPSPILCVCEWESLASGFRGAI